MRGVKVSQKESQYVPTYLYDFEENPPSPPPLGPHITTTSYLLICFSHANIYSHAIINLQMLYT